MSAIKPSVEHRRIADEIWSAIWDKGRADAAPPIATALAEAEARGRKAAFEETAKWHEVKAAERAHFEQSALTRFDYEAADDHREAKQHHKQCATHFRALEPKES